MGNKCQSKILRKSNGIWTTKGSITEKKDVKQFLNNPNAGPNLIGSLSEENIKKFYGH